MIEQFHRPATVREALALKRRLRARAAFLAGGTWLNSSECPRPPEQCISLAGLDLARIELMRSHVSIGALCTVQQVVEDRKVPGPLRAAAAQIASRNVRNMATLGGHVAAHVPHSDLIPMLIALEARLSLAGVSGASRNLTVERYLVRPVPGLVTRILVPRLAAGRVAACRNLRASSNSRSIVSAAVSLSLVRGAVRDPILALGGIEDRALRLGVVERSLDGKLLPSLDVIQSLVERAVRPGASLAG
ncbi:MAG TPA: FAD binding domain-containing protein, partial [Terriglobales bacterium]|nr:FAD binding domain-containing protein [Terriglobales bacterium]